MKGVCRNYSEECMYCLDCSETHVFKQCNNFKDLTIVDILAEYGYDFSRN